MLSLGVPKIKKMVGICLIFNKKYNKEKVAFKNILNIKNSAKKSPTL